MSLMFHFVPEEKLIYLWLKPLVRKVVLKLQIGVVVNKEAGAGWDLLACCRISVSYLCMILSESMDSEQQSEDDIPLSKQYGSLRSCGIFHGLL